jgi:hypothetical protein
MFENDFNYDMTRVNGAYDKVYYNKIKMKLSRNSHGINEVKLDLKKINLKGAISSAIPSNNSYSSFGVITSNENIFNDVLEHCN